MTNQNWNYTYNTFEVNTRYSAKKMSILAPDHLSKLQSESSDPDIAALIAMTEAPVTNFNEKYSNWLAAKGLYMGETNNFTNLLAELSSLKIKQWDAQIQVVFLEGTSQYIAILPNGRGPFQRGPYDIRLAEVAALSTRLGNYPALATLKTTVETYYTDLLNARDEQQQREGLVKQASEYLNEARVALAEQMYKNLALLMAKNFQNPTYIERYFDLELIRSTSNSNDNDTSEPIEGVVASGEIKNIPFIFDTSNIITISNTGTVPLLFYLASSPSADLEPPSIGIIVEPNSITTHNILEFGSNFTNFLNVKNGNAAIIGSYEVTVN